MDWSQINEPVKLRPVKVNKSSNTFCVLHVCPIVCSANCYKSVFQDCHCHDHYLELYFENN